MPLPTFKLKLAWRPVGSFLLTSAALQLLASGTCVLGITPTLSPPQKVIINGERKTLIVCLANDLSEDALSAVWFSNGNGSILKSSSYGISQEEDGTFSCMSQISISTQEFESWDIVTCYVAQNHSSKNRSTTSLQITEENIGDQCLDESQEGQDQTSSPDILASQRQVLLLLAIRILLFKFLLSDVLMTCCILYKKENIPPHWKPPSCSAGQPRRVRSGSLPVNCHYK